MIQDYPHTLRDEPAWVEKATALAGRIIDLTHFLDRVAVLPDEERRAVVLEWQHPDRLSVLDHLQLDGPAIVHLHRKPLTIPHADELRIDPAGNLYGVEQRGNRLLLRVSRDGGRRWSRPKDILAPGARGLENVAVSLRGQPSTGRRGHSCFRPSTQRHGARAAVPGRGLRCLHHA